MPSKTGTRWKCPKCGRRFVHPNQAHSCQVVPLRAHLRKADPTARALYQAVIAAIRTCGPLQVAPTKTGINLLSGTSLGGITLHPGYLNLGLVLTHRVEDPRVVSVLQISPRSFAHRFRLRSLAELDPQLKAWIREAYAVGKMAGRRPS